ncbi:acyl-CoA dehydrogenase family protein [Streptomyces sp. TRM68416]|uniref:acyl-CoA dehydrogenase family protein n=1 Tax=Streptomyces sp. TRM68416 TaxID=2758412 RepID=UPI0016619952|nr:acyl-CoA dehydrogenase family protein [Streptomyces sp. TRM68416]MBD0842331.1 hydrolase [Streptomyces sp. TRM68416]
MSTAAPAHTVPPHAPRTAELGAVAARFAERTEALRALPAEVVDALRDAGFARHLAPTAHGGADGSYSVLLHAVAEIGENCAATAWNAAVYAVLGRMAAHLPPAGRAEIWGAEPGADALFAASIAPAGQVVRDGDGYRLSGTWPFASGVDDAAWTLLGAFTPEREYRFFMVPRAAYRVLDTWDNVGLAGTGSHAVVLDDVPVPARLTCAQADLMAGVVDGERRLVPFKAVNGLTFVAPALGAARAALRDSAARLAGKTEITGKSARANPAAQTALARAGAEIDAAALLLERAAAAADTGSPTSLELARAPRDFAYAAELLGSAVDRLFRTGGARTQHTGGSVQRAWRDVNCAAGHAVLQFGTAAVVYADHLMDAESARNGEQNDV